MSTSSCNLRPSRGRPTRNGRIVPNYQALHMAMAHSFVLAPKTTRCERDGIFPKIARTVLTHPLEATNNQQPTTTYRVMMPSTRNESKEVIETIVLEPPPGSYEDEDSAIALSSSFATDSGRISAGPLLEKPRRVRVVSFKNQQELAEKLQGVMMHPTSGFITQEALLLQPPTSATTTTGRRNRRSLSEQGRPKAAGSAFHKKTRSLPTKHCIVDLDDAYELYPAVSSITSLSWVNPNHCSCIHTTQGEDGNQYEAEEDDEKTEVNISSLELLLKQEQQQSYPSRKISVIPEPRDEDNDDEGILAAATTPSMSSKHKHQKARSSRGSKKTIEREDVLRTRQWGRRLRIPVHLLRPPMIRRQVSSE